MELPPQFYDLMGLGTILFQILTVVGLLLLLNIKFKLVSLNWHISKQQVLVIQYAIAMIAMVGSLIMSDAVGYLPCKLCWYQRIAMYPQAFIYLLALIKNDDSVADYGLLLSVIGLGLALYHYLLQMKILLPTICSTTGFGVSCSDIEFTIFGYITIPMMALSTFALIIVIWLLYKYQPKATNLLRKPKSQKP